MNTSLGHTLPLELVREIMIWVIQFQQAETAERIRVFKSSFGPFWSTIMGDIRMNTPRYTTLVMSTGGTRFFVSVFSPDCDPSSWVGMIPHRMIRRALSVHREFLTDTPQNRVHYSILDAGHYSMNMPNE